MMHACKPSISFVIGRGRNNVVQLLLDHLGESIDLNIKNNNGETAMMIASHRGHQDIVQLIESKFTFSSQLTFFARKFINLLPFWK